MFADDLFYSQIFKKTGNLNKSINSYLNNLETWLNNWRLKMAPHKCNFMIFGKRTDLENKKLQFRLYNQLIPHTDEVTFLGIRLDPHLNLKNQINYLTETAAKRLNIIRILSHKSWKLDQSTLTQIYNTLIRSLFDYTSIFSSALSDSQINKLQVIQNNALRAILKKKKTQRSKSFIN